MARRHKRSKRQTKTRHGRKTARQTARAKQQPSVEQALGLAVQSHNAGDLQRAKGIYEQILQVDRRQPEALHLLGVIALQVRDFRLAIELIAQALAVRPDYADAHCNLGVALKQSGRLEDAVASYCRALAINPDYVEAHNNLGVAYLELGRLPDAVACFGRALAIRPDYAEANSNLGAALGELGEQEDAMANFRKALSIQPNHADAHSNLGQLLERLNRLDEAEVHVQKALAIAPDHHGANVLLAALLRRRGQIQEATEVLERLPLESLRGANVPKAYFELGKLYDRTLDSERAFDCFAKGNAAQATRRGSGLDADRYLRAVEKTSRWLTPQSVAAWAGNEHTTADGLPIFLVGFPRSGTTLLDQILDGHPRLQVMEEQPAVDSIASAIDKLPDGYPAAVASLQGAEIANLRLQYDRLVGQRIARESETILVDKYPLNIRHIPLIVRLFPGARILLALRHPADVVLSNFMQQYRLNDAMASFHTLEGTARLYVQVMSLWRQCVELLPLNAHAVKYEDLVADLEGESRRLIEFLDVEWTDAVLDYHNHARQRENINTPSYEQVTEPIYQRAKYRWKRYERQLAPVLEQLQPFVEAFGYV